MDLGVQEADDVKLNFGEQMLLGLLRQWAEQRESIAQEEQWGGQVRFDHALTMSFICTSMLRPCCVSICSNMMWTAACDEC